MTSEIFPLKIAEIDKKIEQLKAKKQSLISREKEQERKARTRRLIEIGAIVEKGLTISSTQKAQALVEYLTKHPDNFKKLTDYLENTENKV